MDTAVRRGARVIAPILITEYNCTSKGVVVASEDGAEFAGQALILANGYEMPSFVPASAHRIVSTWALATPPQAPEVLWPERALVWEASTPYFYMRTTPENRIIIGGEDDEITGARDRDAAIPTKTKQLLAKLSELAPSAVLKAETAWAGFFGETHDGLPLLGRVPGMPNCFAAYGYGGNGCTFSALAADMLLNLISGGSDPLEGAFAIDR
jgi:glycine/D-amino acid oxidase-like deaminating enzyme